MNKANKIKPKGLDSLIKRKNPSVAKAEAENRKNLIINSGVARTVTRVHDDGNIWVSSTDIACMYCCHGFETTPVGIPTGIINGKYRCYGNFCSYNCAKRYLCPDHNDEDDMATVMAYGDLYVGEPYSEKLQLLELMYHIETDAPIEHCIKPAPKRLVLKLFGGNKTIEEYRASFSTNTTFHVFQTPISSMGYEIEECTTSSLDNHRILRHLPKNTRKIHDLLQSRNN